MAYGFKGKIKEIVLDLDAARDGGRDISLTQYIAENFKDVNGVALSPTHLHAELGIDPNRTQFGDLMKDADTAYLAAEIIRQGVRRGMGLAQRQQVAEMRKRAMASFGPITSEANGGQRFVSPEVFLDPVNRGAVQSTFFPDLVIREETVLQPTVIIPKIDLSDAALKDTTEAATIEEGTISYATKNVTVYTKARAIKITDEALMFSTLSLVQLFMEDVGRILGNTLNGMAIDTIVNGDQADTSEAAAVVGVENTSNGITWFDLARVAIQLGLLGRTGTQVIGNATTALNYLNLPEVKNKQFAGAPLLATMMKSPLTMPEQLYVSTKVGASKIVIQDPGASLVQLTAQPLRVETERIAMKRINGTLISIMTGFAKIQKNASVVLDGSIAYSGNGFPSFMQPLA